MQRVGNCDVKSPTPAKRRPGYRAPKFLEYLVILRFEKRYPIQNTVARLKSKILAPPKVWAGYHAELRLGGSTLNSGWGGPR